MTSFKTAVLIHGCHLQADLNGKAWREIVWGGETPTLEGRATTGIRLAVRHNAQYVIFPTGASEKDGMKEGEYTYRYAIADAAEIARAVGVEKNFLKQFLKSRHVLDLVSQNTRDECERNFEFCAETGIERIFVVSSPWHIQRCHTEAIKAADKLWGKDAGAPEIYAVASQGATEGVVILEPSHRGDQPKNRFAELGARFFKLKSERRTDFEHRLVHLLADFDA